MWGTRNFDVMLIFRCTDEIERLDEEQSRHEKMNPVKGMLVFETE